MDSRLMDDRRGLLCPARLAWAAGTLLVALAIAGCTVAVPSSTLPPAPTLPSVPTPMPASTLTKTSEPAAAPTDPPEPTVTPSPSPLATVAGRVLSWTSVQMPAGLAAGIDSSFQNSLFGWSRGYVAFHENLLNGSAVPWVSPDGRTWESGPALDVAGLAGGAVVVDVVEGPAGLLALGRAPGCADDGGGCMPAPATALWASADGVHWARLDLRGAFSGVAVGDVSAGARGYMAVSMSSGTTARPAVWLSEDGLAWRGISLPPSTFSGANLAQAVVLPEGFLIAGRTGSLAGWGGGYFPSTTPAVWYSADGSDWTRETLPGAAAAPEAEASVAIVGAGKLVAHVVSWDCACPPDGDTQAWTSSDGRAWRASDIAFPSPAVVLTDGRQALQLVPADGVLTVAVSSDGFHWAQIPVPGLGPADEDVGVYGPAGLLVEGSDASLWLATVTGAG